MANSRWSSWRSVPQCRECAGGALRRINRSTFWEQRVLPWLGFYPWECVLCRGRVLLRLKGERQWKRRLA